MCAGICPRTTRRLAALGWRRLGIGRSAACLVAFGLASVLVVAPYLARNAQVVAANGRIVTLPDCAYMRRG